MAEVRKGIVTQVTTDGAIVRPLGGRQSLTPEMKQPSGGVAVGDFVAFVLFEDGTGCILNKM